jgi:hypothetical protein
VNILICIDDTDNLESRGTGELAEELAAVVRARGWGTCSFVTRHQLLVHPDVPYTSHNSSMCFAADIDDQYLKALVEFAAAFLKDESAPGSDPGLAVAVPTQLPDAAALVEFGCRAKREVLTKEQAYDLADAQGMHLSEHGGTGHGVIGALAGIGLRLSGNDGRLKGWFDISTRDGVARVADILAQCRISGVRSMSGELLAPEELVAVGEKPKAVFLTGKPYLMVSPAAEAGTVRWQTSSRRELKQY